MNVDTLIVFGFFGALAAFVSARLGIRHNLKQKRAPAHPPVIRNIVASDVDYSIENVKLECGHRLELHHHRIKAVQCPACTEEQYKK